MVARWDNNASGGSAEPEPEPEPNPDPPTPDPEPTDVADPGTDLDLGQGSAGSTVDTDADGVVVDSDGDPGGPSTVVTGDPDADDESQDYQEVVAVTDVVRDVAADPGSAVPSTVVDAGDVVSEAGRSALEGSPVENVVDVVPSDDSGGLSGWLLGGGLAIVAVVVGIAALAMDGGDG